MESWDYEVFWKETVNQIRHSISKEEFTMWFNNITYSSSSENMIVLSVPSNFFMDQIKQRYLSLITETMEELSGNRIAVSFTVKKNDTEKKEKSSRGKKGTEEKLQEKIVTEKHPDLREDYSFENFVIGENNSFAANAALAISNNPGKAYNPFLIYGGVGLGKTHLLQAIGHAIHEKSEAKKKVVFVTAENFTNEFVNSLQKNKPHVFKNKYRSVDLLLVDDIHFFQNKEGLQEELFHTFNALYGSKKQMVFTCDRPVSELKNITDRMKSRFEMGLNVELNPPNFETRFAILKNKVESLGINISDDILELIAQNITSNVRDIESALIKLVAYAELVNRKITKEIAQQQLIDVFTTSRQSNVSIDIIQKKVAEYFNLSHVDLRGRKRTKAVAFPRQVAMYITRELTEYSTTEIGSDFGGRDHTTVMHAIQKIEGSLKSDPTMEPVINNIVRLIKEQSSKG
ncbi:MAG: chromosomal replication initiator protein DnaA [Spirochaetia bacterium]|jgi:chromosomal replication initiator protein|nr:chromosomal replication initiator protein DnaA [Spirochaetia bacterium]